MPCTPMNLSKLLSKMYVNNMSTKCEPSKIWMRFETKGKDGNPLKLRIQNLPSERKDDAIKFMINYFMPEEAVNIAAGIPKNGKAIEEYRVMFTNVIEDPKTHTIICCKDDQPIVEQIIGLLHIEVATNTKVNTSYQKEVVFKTKEMQNLLHILKVLKDYTTDTPFEIYYNDTGMAVHPDYRGLHLGNKLITATKLVSIEHNVPILCSWMTAIGTQRAADKNNWKTIATISPEELDKVTGLTFKKEFGSFKLMYTTIE